jgi:hypothetical protein
MVGLSHWTVIDGIGVLAGVWALAVWALVVMTLSAVAVIVRSNFMGLKIGYWADPAILSVTVSHMQVWNRNCSIACIKPKNYDQME